MKPGRLGIIEIVLRIAYRFQSFHSVRAFESACLLLFLGGYYVLAVVRLFGQYAPAFTDTLVNLPMLLQMALTVGVPFTILLLEWLAGLYQLRHEPGFAEWNLEERLLVWFEIITVERAFPVVIYLPLLPLALFWTFVLAVELQAFYQIPAIIFVADALAIIGVNWFVKQRDPQRVPAGTTLDFGRLGRSRP